MRTLVLGAGAIGGYFGGRLLEAGRDVTFLVRPRRAAVMAECGLDIESPFGNASLPSPATVTADRLGGPFDLVLLTCKAYDLDASVRDIAPAVGPRTLVVPMLNGLRHLETLDAAFGADRVLGGKCHISTRLDPSGKIVHLSNVHDFVYGHRTPGQRAAAEALRPLFEGAKFTAVLSEDIVLEMWEKWFFLATLAGINCLMRGSVGDIVAAGGARFTERLLEECRSIAESAGYPPRPHVCEDLGRRLVHPRSGLTASMLTDLEAGGPTEADHILTDLLRHRPPTNDAFGLLDLAVTHLKTFEVRTARERAKATPELA